MLGRHQRIVVASLVGITSAATQIRLERGEALDEIAAELAPFHIYDLRRVTPDVLRMVYGMRIGSRRLAVVAGAAIVVIIAVSAAAYVALRPRKDPGVAACEAMRDHVDMGTSAEDRYHQARDAYAGSRYPDLSDAGVKFADVTWSVTQATNANKLAPASQALSAYTALATACGNHGVRLAPLGN